MGLSHCPACLDQNLVELIHWPSLPSNTSLFLPSAEEARAYPRGSFRFTRCGHCGFLFNADHDPRLTEYSERSIETQSWSDHHGEFAKALAEAWIERYGLRGRPVLEIGPGHEAAFLRLFCDLSGGTGIGIGPSVSSGPISQLVSLRTGLFDDSSVELPGDAVICRHTLEHISDIHAFFSSLRLWADRHPSAVHLFELPDTQRILDEIAFWDLYYEHCSYFTPETLASTFAAAGFDVQRSELVYDDQYIILEARPSSRFRAPDEIGRARIANRISEETSRFVRDLDEVASRLEEMVVQLANDGPVLFWQAGSKAAGMFAVLAIADKVEALVDINPEKQGLYLAGSGHPIIGPDQIEEYSPRHIVMMNPVYESEIAALLSNSGIDAELHSAYGLSVARD